MNLYNIMIKIQLVITFLNFHFFFNSCSFLTVYSVFLIEITY